MREKFGKQEWLCGCTLITEPLSHYQWYPCDTHKDLAMFEVMDILADETEPELQELEDVLLTIEII